MIIRKPYAFLMKNFKKIHILLLILCVFIFYKTNTFYSFVKQYVSSGVYNKSIDAVSNYASQFFYLVIFLVFFILGAIIILLKKKKKPIWDYIALSVEYIFVFIVFIIAARYFNNLGNNVMKLTVIRPIRDLLLICSIPQYAVFVLLIIRILGIDLNKFGFKEDEEFKEITEDDREEVEVAVEFDKDVYKRELKKRIRFLKYYYKENTFFLNVVFSVIAVILVIIIGIAIKNGDRTYREGKIFNTANYYQISVNKSYSSIYDAGGNIIEKTSGFIIVNVTVKNNSISRIMDIEKFLLVSNKNVYVPTLKYNKSFKDLGKGFAKKEFKRGSTNTFILVYKLPKEDLNKKHMLYYQNIKGRFESNYLKVKIKPIKMSEKKSNGTVSLKQKINIDNKTIKIDDYDLGDNFSYLRKSCMENGCSVVSEELNGNGKKIIKLTLDTADFTGNEFIDFLDTCGTIVYRVDGKRYKEKIKNPINYSYNGSSSYFMVSKNIEKADEIYIKITLRSNDYTYYLKGGKNNEGNDK